MYLYVFILKKRKNGGAVIYRLLWNGFTGPAPLRLKWAVCGSWTKISLTPLICKSQPASRHDSLRCCSFHNQACVRDAFVTFLWTSELLVYYFWHRGWQLLCLVLGLQSLLLIVTALSQTQVFPLLQSRRTQWISTKSFTALWMNLFRLTFPMQISGKQLPSILTKKLFQSVLQ